MPADNQIEQKLFEAFRDYLDDCFEIELLDRFGYAEESENKVGIFGGVTFSEQALPGPDISMDSSGFYRSVFVFTIKTYALDDKQGLQLRQETGKLRDTIHREGLSEVLNEFIEGQTIIAILQGGSDQGESGNFRTMDLKYTIYHSNLKEGL